MEITETFFSIDRDSWRAWLKGNHDEKREIWLVLNKKHVKEPCISYDEAVEEALCFGWIDGIMKRIDERQYTIRFTPRRKNSIWSGLNVERVKKMIDHGKMLDIGLKKFNERSVVYSSISINGKEVDTPQWFNDLLKEEEEVWKKFQGFSPSHKNQFLQWIMMAKKEETRLRRARKAFEMIKNE